MDDLLLSDLDFKHLIYASTVASCGSITKAAGELFVAPPNLSRAIGELEEKLGFSLFIRTKKGMIPTAEGERLLAASDEMMNGFKKVIAGCRKSQETGFFFSCVPSSLFVNVFLGAVPKLSGFRISSREYSSAEEFFQSVAKGKADAGFIIFGKSMGRVLRSYMEEKGLVYHYLAESPLYLIFGEDSPVRRPEDGQIPDLTGSRLIFNSAYYEPLGIRLDQLPYELPKAASIQKGGGRAANLDMLDAMEDCVLLTCRFHSRILTRNHLTAVPYHPEIPVYEYGYITKEGQEFTEGWKMVMECIVEDFKKEFARPLQPL